jgi:YHS domain-containing protein
MINIKLCIRELQLHKKDEYNHKIFDKTYIFCNQNNYFIFNY